MFVNLTQHTILVEVQVQDTFQIISIEPEPVSAVVAAVEEVIGLVESGECIATVSRHTFGQIEGLPEPKPDTIFIVSGMVRDALDGRPDVLAPDTGKTAVRNQQGQVAYVTRLRGK
jgi:hypothetical protein